MKNALKVTSVIIGTVIGAGFASGKEIELFFFQYGIKGILGLVISSILTGFIILKVYRMIIKQQISSYDEFLSKISHNQQISQIMKHIIELFLLISFYVMIAGVSSYFYQEFQIPTIFSASIMALLCYITFQNNMKGVISINSVLIPLLIFFIVYLGIKNIGFTYQSLLVQQNVAVFHEVTFGDNWLFSSILYASYNSIVLIPILIELSQYMNSKKTIKITSILCTSILLVLGTCLFSLLLREGNNISQFELPLIQVVKQFGAMYQWVYGIVIVAAIFTSAISTGYSFLKNSGQSKKTYQYWSLFLCVSAVFISNIGFAKLVTILYPVFGVLGLTQIVLLFITIS